MALRAVLIDDRRNVARKGRMISRRSRSWRDCARRFLRLPATPRIPSPKRPNTRHQGRPGHNPHGPARRPLRAHNANFPHQKHLTFDAGSLSLRRAAKTSAAVCERASASALACSTFKIRIASRINRSNRNKPLRARRSPQQRQITGGYELFCLAVISLGLDDHPFDICSAARRRNHVKNSMKLGLLILHR